MEDPFEIEPALNVFERWAGVPVADFLDLLRSGRDVFGRDTVDGHFTASAFVVSADGGRVALAHHRKLGRWIQPGGHADGDMDLRRVALREVTEETGLQELTCDGLIFDLDRHWFPERAAAPGHWHCDVRFIVRACVDEQFNISDESNDLRWWPIEAVADGAEFHSSLRLMARRWLAAGGDPATRSTVSLP